MQPCDLGLYSGKALLALCKAAHVFPVQEYTPTSLSAKKLLCLNLHYCLYLLRKQLIDRQEVIRGILSLLQMTYCFAMLHPSAFA